MRGGDLRQRTSPPTSHPAFSLRQYNNTTQALKHFGEDFDFAVPCQGYQDYSRRETDESACERNKQWILIKANSPQSKAVLESIDYGALAMRGQTGPPGFRLWSLVREYRNSLSLEPLFGELLRDKDRFLAGSDGKSFEKAVSDCLQRDCGFWQLSKDDLRQSLRTGSVDWTSLRDAVQSMDHPAPELPDVLKLGGCFVAEPYGSQNYPDFLVWDSDGRTVPIEVKCLDKGATKPVWNGGLPRADGIYVVGSRGQTMDVTFFLGDDVLGGPERQALNQFFDDIRPEQQRINGQLCKNQPYGFGIYVRKAFKQDQKVNPGACLDWFANPKRRDLEQSVIDSVIA